MSVLIRLMFAVLVAYLFYRMVCRLMRSDRKNDGQHIKGNKAVAVYQDPVCGVYLSEGESLIEIYDGKRYHFCSDRCHQEFKKQFNNK